MIVLVLNEIVLTGSNRIPANTKIVVDTAKRVGYWKGVHFDIHPDEYLPLQ